MNPPHRNPNKQQHRSGPSNFADGLDALLDPGTVIDGFTRLSALGLELATIDGPCRIQRLDEDGGPGRGQPALRDSDDEELAESDDKEEDEEFLTRQAELEEMDRVELKAELKKLDPSFRVFKSHSDDDLRDAILDAEFPA